MASEYVSTGRVEGGKLKVRNRARFEQAFKSWRDCEVIITIEKAHATRNLEQNKLYWAGYVKPLAEYTGYSPKWIHAYLKKRFLPANHLMIQDKDGVIVDEADVDALTTTTLDKVQFGEYLRDVEEFALTLKVVVGSNREDAA